MLFLVKKLRLAALLLLATWLAIVPAVGTSLADDSSILTIGRVSDNPEKNLPRIRAMAEFLAGSLGMAGGAAIVAKDNEEMARLLRDGRVQLVSESALSAIWFEENVGAQPLLHEWKKGVATYESIFFVRRDSGVEVLQDLRGRVIAFEDPGSTTGFLAPFAMLRAAGLDPVEIQPGETPPAGRVGYVFTRSEENVAAWVARGIADAGAFSNLDWAEIHETSEVLMKDLRMLDQSGPILRSILLVGPNMSAELKQQLQAILQSAHENPAAEEALSTYYRVKRYDPIEGKSLQSLNATRRLFGVVRDIM